MDLQVSRELSILKFNDKLSLSLAGKATLNDLTNFQPILLDLAKPRLMFYSLPLEILSFVYLSS